MRSLVIVDPAATGRAGTVGVYRSPFSLPNGEILASYAANVTDPTTQIPKYDLVAVAADGTRRALASDPSLSYVEAALGYKRAERELFTNLPQLVFGGHGDAAGGAPADPGVMHFPDLPVLATLLGANLRHGRDVKAFDGTASLRVYQENPPTSLTPPLTGSQMVFSDRKMLGVAGLESDHSVKVTIPSGTPLILELIDGSGKTVVHDARGASTGPRRIRHARSAARGLQRHLRRLPRLADRRGAGRRGDARRAHRARRCRCRGIWRRSHCSERRGRRVRRGGGKSVLRAPSSIVAPGALRRNSDSNTVRCIRA